MNKILTLEQMKNMSIDDITQLYREGYGIEENSKILTGSQIPPMNHKPPTEPMYIYSVKFLCGRAGGHVLNGNYATAINIHNPHKTAVCLSKRVVIAFREETRGIISNLYKYRLDPDDAFEIDCPDIRNILENSGQYTERFIKGFVIIESPKELDVVGVYTAGGNVNVESIDVETINPKIINIIPDPPPQPVYLNTGFNQISGTSISIGNMDDDWMVTVDPTGETTPRPATVVSNTSPGLDWPAPFANSQWISYNEDSGYVSGTFEYQYNFELPQCYSNARLWMKIRADNKASVCLNDHYIDETSDYYHDIPPTIMTTSDPTFFATGQNNLTVDVYNSELITGFDLIGVVIWNYP